MSMRARSVDAIDVWIWSSLQEHPRGPIEFIEDSRGMAGVGFFKEADLEFSFTDHLKV